VWPKTEQKSIEIIDVQEEQCGLTHIACAIVLVFFADKAVFGTTEAESLLF